MARARTKGKDDAPEVVCLVENGRLVPAYPHDAEVLASYSKGAKVFVSMRRHGKRRQHSIWYGLIGDMVKTGQTQWASAKAADRACRIALDMIEPAKTVDGGWLSYDASLWDFSDEELDERIELLRALFRKITGLDPDDVRRELGGGKFDDGYDPPANDAGDETLAGEVSVAPTEAGEEGTSVEIAPPTDGTGATESQAKASEDNGTTAQPTKGAADSVTGEASRPSVGGGSDASHSRADGGADIIMTHTNIAEPPPPELSAEERLWLKQGAKMMVAATPPSPPSFAELSEALRVMNTQGFLVKDIAPSGVSNACLDRMQIINLHTRGVCKGQHDLDVGLVARTALATIEDVTPDPVKVRDGK